MTQGDLAAFVRALDRFPKGTCYGTFEGRRYVTTKSVFSAGKSLKLVAEELGGADYISLNLYNPASGPKLRPCEMSDVKVTAFVTGFVPDHPPD